MKTKHFLLKCNRCGWHIDIDEVCIANPCPQCKKENIFNIVSGTYDELIEYIKNLEAISE